MKRPIFSFLKTVPSTPMTVPGSRTTVPIILPTPPHHTPSTIMTIFMEAHTLSDCPTVTMNFTVFGVKAAAISPTYKSTRFDINKMSKSTYPTLFCGQ